MSRPPVSIVILAWNAWSSTRACLDSLRPTLGVRDEVIVVDNGSTDETPAALQRYPWVTVVSNAQNRGFAGGCNDGATAATRDILIFLNNDTLLTGRWIEPMVAALTDQQVGAAGPRSNFVSGPQLVERATYTTTSEMRRFSREWCRQHRGEATDTSRLVGFCLAIRAELFSSVGGFDESYGIGGYEDDDLCRRVLAAGHRLVICHDSFVHHEGHKTFDVNGLDWYAEQEKNRERFQSTHSTSGMSRLRISACLITKDEEKNLPTCLQSIKGLVDEIVIYDTGSSDGTIGIAETAGATVVPGFWDDDFSRARNAALEHCSGEWILWLDADENLRGVTPETLRPVLAGAPRDIDALSVEIHNEMGSGVGSSFIHRAARLFRRTRCEWSGRIHEQVVRRGTHAPIRQGEFESGYIHHTGYLDSVITSRNKRERNLHLARVEVETSDGWEKAHSLTSLARSCILAGRYGEGYKRAFEALALGPSAVVRRMALRAAIEGAIGMDRLDEALTLCADLRKVSDNSLLPNMLEAQVRLALEEWEAALDLIDHAGHDDLDSDGFGYTAGSLAIQRAEALGRLGRHGEAADTLISVLFEEGVLDAHIGNVIELLDKAGRSLEKLGKAIPNSKAPVFLAQALQLDPSVADRLLEACVAIPALATPTLAAAASLAVRLPVDRALVWSARIRAAGYTAACPLIAISRGPGSPVVRARAAATALRAFSDLSARRAFEDIYQAATTTERGLIDSEMAELCPDLVAVGDGIRHSPTNPFAHPSSTTVTDPQAMATTPRMLSADGASTRALPAGPRVTVIIPCFNEATQVLACLQALRGATDPSLYEVVLVDDGSEDSISQLPTVSEGSFRLVRNQEHHGVGPASNQGAALANGEYICFLSSDTVVQGNWLDPLLTALNDDPRLGAVQPRLLFPNGRLKDAGGLMFPDGTAQIYGEGEPDPDAPEFTSRRAPDYLSGGCLLVRRDAFVGVGGFDQDYESPDFLRRDLSFNLRDHGWKILYEPASTVVMTGTDRGNEPDIDNVQRHSCSRLAERWRGQFLPNEIRDTSSAHDWAHRPQGGFGPGESLTGSAAGETRRLARRVLVIDLTMPVYDRASGSLRLFNLIRCLREAGHAVTFYSATGGDRRYADIVGRYGITCYGADPGREGRSHQDLYAPPLPILLSQRKFDVVMVSPWSLGEHLVPVIRQFAPNASLWLDTNDVHFLRLERAASLSGTAQDWQIAEETRRRELDVYRMVDRVIAVSQQDADLLSRELPEADIRVVPNAHDLPPTGPGYDSREGAIFVGNFNHLPNGDAVRWWKQEIAARLEGRLALSGLTVVGNDPFGTAAKLQGTGVNVVGTVPSTLPYLYRARVSVAPLRYGAGMKGKVGEALAAGVPVVATPIAAEGMSLVDGEHVLIADSPEAFARSVQRLHDDRALWEALRENGRAHVAAHFGLDRLRRELDALMGLPVTAS